MPRKNYLRLGTNFESNTRSGSLGVIDSLGTSLNIRADAVVVAGGEGVQVVETVEGDGVFRSVVTKGSRVTGDLAFSKVVGSLSSDEEAITTENSVSSKGRTLQSSKLASEFIIELLMKVSYLENINDSTSMETRLLVNSVEKCRLLVLLRKQRGIQVELETLRNLILELNLGFQDVGGCPTLGEDKAVLEVGILGLNVPIDGIVFGLATRGPKSDA